MSSSSAELFWLAAILVPQVSHDQRVASSEDAAMFCLAEIHGMVAHGSRISFISSVKRLRSIILMQIRLILQLHENLRVLSIREPVSRAIRRHEIRVVYDRQIS